VYELKNEFSAALILVATVELSNVYIISVGVASFFHRDAQRSIAWHVWHVLIVCSLSISALYLVLRTPQLQNPHLISRLTMKERSDRRSKNHNVHCCCSKDAIGKPLQPETTNGSAKPMHAGYHGVRRSEELHYGHVPGKLSHMSSLLPSTPEYGQSASEWSPHITSTKGSCNQRESQTRTPFFSASTNELNSFNGGIHHLSCKKIISGKLHQFSKPKILKRVEGVLGSSSVVASMARNVGSTRWETASRGNFALVMCVHIMMKTGGGDVRSGMTETNGGDVRTKQ
jgi:hypothetical protein